MPPRKDPIKEAFQKISSLRDDGYSPEAVKELKTIIEKQSGMVVAKAAPVVVEWYETSLCNDLEQCFYRLIENGANRDPQCWGKVAIIKALHDLLWQDSAVYILGCKTVQMEPVRGGFEDSAVSLRIASIEALMQRAVTDNTVLMETLADLIADPSRRVRAEAVRASIYGSAEVVGPMLRLKIRMGDEDARVLGNCFDALLAKVLSQSSVDLVNDFLLAEDEVLAAEAMASLASSSLPEAIHKITSNYETFEDEQLRRILLTSLGASPTQEALDFLYTCLERPLPDARWALTALEPKIHNDEIKEKVIELLDQRNDDLKSEIGDL